MAAENATVLVVDDDPNSIELIIELLDGTGLEVITAQDGREALEIVHDRGAVLDVILSDRMMPRMDGMELLREVKKDPGTTTLPVIMITAAADRQAIIEGIDAGAYYYMAKPFDGAVLVSMVKAAAADHKRYRELHRVVSSQTGTLGLMRSGIFDFKSPGQASHLGTFLAKACPDSERVVVGLTELLINAVEHGNLEIGYDEKTELNRTGRWQQEIDARLSSPEFARRVATARFERGEQEITIQISDQGNGFDPVPFLTIDPLRVYHSHGRGIAMANLMSFHSLEYRDGGRDVVGKILCDSAG